MRKTAKTKKYGVRFQMISYIMHQESPGIAWNGPELSGIARLPGIARNCLELPRIARIRPDSDRIAGNCPELPGIAWGRFQMVYYIRQELLSSLIFLLKDSLKLTNITLLK